MDTFFSCTWMLSTVMGCFVDRARSLKVNSRVHSPGEEITITVGEKITITADSNPAPANYTWVNTTSNAIIATGDSITVTGDMLGSQSLNLVVCNTIPIPSPHSTCSEYPMNIKVKGKCCLMLIVLCVTMVYCMISGPAIFGFRIRTHIGS